MKKYLQNLQFIILICGLIKILYIQILLAVIFYQNFYIKN